MAEFPALPLFTDAIIADCSHLTDAEFGMYVRLLMLIWRSPECRIPHDTEWIARRMQRPFKDIDPVITEFCKVDANWITQKRLQKERAYLKEKSKKQSARAKSRWNNENDSCRGNAALHQSGNAPTLTPTPNKDPLTPKGEPELFWKAYPKKVGKGAFVKAYARAITKIEPAALHASMVKHKFSTDKQYIPNPATWLNQERWLDEAEAVIDDNEAYLKAKAMIEAGSQDPHLLAFVKEHENA